MIMILWFNDNGNCLFFFLSSSSSLIFPLLTRWWGAKDQIEKINTLAEEKKVYTLKYWLFVLVFQWLSYLEINSSRNLWPISLTTAARSICYLCWPRYCLHHLNLWSRRRRKNVHWRQKRENERGKKLYLLSARIEILSNNQWLLFFYIKERKNVYRPKKSASTLLFCCYQYEQIETTHTSLARFSFSSLLSLSYGEMPTLPCFLWSHNEKQILKSEHKQ